MKMGGDAVPFVFGDLKKCVCLFDEHVVSKYGRAACSGSRGG